MTQTITTTFDFVETLNGAIYLTNATVPAIAIAAGVIVAAWLILRVYGWVKAAL